MKVFRKMRSTLVEKGNFSKYLKYAVGEIILVILGILFALQINNWNKSRIEKNAENESIVFLIEDLATDTTNINLTLKHNEQRIKLLDSLSFLCFNYDLNQKNDPALYRTYINNITHPTFFTSTDRTTSQLKNTGGIGLIKSKESVNSIISYEAYLKKIYNQQEWYRLMLKDLVEAGIPIFNYNYYYKKSKDDLNLAKLNLNDYQTMTELGNRSKILRGMIGKYSLLLKDGKIKAINLIHVLEDNYNK